MTQPLHLKAYAKVLLIEGEVRQIRRKTNLSACILL